jgi:hypothetical protein
MGTFVRTAHKSDRLRRKFTDLESRPWHPLCVETRRGFGSLKWERPASAIATTSGLDRTRRIRQPKPNQAYFLTS